MAGRLKTKQKAYLVSHEWNIGSSRPHEADWLESARVLQVDLDRKDEITAQIEHFKTDIKVFTPKSAARCSDAAVHMAEEYRSLARRNLAATAVAPSQGTLLQRQLGALRAAVWTELDTNGDGVADRAEVRRLLHRLQLDASDRNLNRIMAVLDRNGDGKLSRDELQAGIAERRIASRLQSIDPLNERSMLPATSISTLTDKPVSIISSSKNKPRR
eukprot:TRINITY_DN9282_c0_g1_i1.p1 TRINITY_DN9282_c0_g1~~TRINITY_DN9282_c0_g1_i1.p1  ORF type:complete len:216 (+),score=55.15 TRINITY_DN9282_c0_g1_i1:1065-1712(+)